MRFAGMQCFVPLLSRALRCWAQLCAVRLCGATYFGRCFWDRLLPLNLNDFSDTQIEQFSRITSSLCFPIHYMRLQSYFNCAISFFWQWQINSRNFQEARHAGLSLLLISIIFLAWARLRLYCSDVAGAFDRVSCETTCSKLVCLLIHLDLLSMVFSWLVGRFEKVTFKALHRFIIVSKIRVFQALHTSTHCGICFLFLTPFLACDSVRSRTSYMRMNFALRKFKKSVLNYFTRRQGRRHQFKFHEWDMPTPLPLNRATQASTFCFTRNLMVNNFGFWVLLLMFVWIWMKLSFNVCRRSLSLVIFALSNKVLSFSRFYFAWYSSSFILFAVSQLRDHTCCWSAS